MGDKKGLMKPEKGLKNWSGKVETKFYEYLYLWRLGTVLWKPQLDTSIIGWLVGWLVAPQTLVFDFD